MAKDPHVSISLTGLAMVVLLIFSSSFLQAAQGSDKKMAMKYDVPVKRLVYRPSAMQAAVIGTEAAAYEPFELCMGCRCCASSNASSCVDTRCCYAIDCNIPGKPFGVCAFSPHSCDCGATNCTSQQQP
ncbi:uncharacterized protein LOC127757648 [Oryza glaberrima]|uniref:DUF7866 domain-containing protein n=2 Tax=Oryza TaxID=4527 RepID=A0A0D3HQS7_9ORYZ|nr:uncharacterized protein LOC127757648 [Oryza glaberrima]